MVRQNRHRHPGKRQGRNKPRFHSAGAGTGRGLGACKGTKPKEKGCFYIADENLLQRPDLGSLAPSPMSHTATALCSGAVAFFHPTPAMDIDPYPGHCTNWWIHGFLFNFLLLLFFTWSVREVHVQQTPRKKVFPQNTCPSERCHHNAAFSERKNTRMCPVLLSLTEPESTDKA